MGQTLLGGPGTAGRHRAARTHGHDAYLLPKAVGSMIEGAANSEALFEEKERAQITLNSIGDAVMSTDVSGRVTYLNAIAEGLTGYDRLAEAIALSSHHQRKLAVLFLDLDRFKHINDSLGHVIGDRLLQSVGSRLSMCVRIADTVSRQGGDEFVVLLWEVRHAQDAAITADKILQALRKPHHIDQHELHITGSIGIVTYPDDGTDVEKLMMNADFAMYHAKDSGRDNYQFFKWDMNERGIERQRLFLHCQPKINLATGAIIGVEALIRWHHPQRELVPPAQFIAIAEECGLIVPIGRWVLREACRQAHTWLVAGLPLMCIAINISSVELRVPGFASGVREILTEKGLG